MKKTEPRAVRNSLYIRNSLQAAALAAPPLALPHVLLCHDSIFLSQLPLALITRMGVKKTEGNG